LEKGKMKTILLTLSVGTLLVSAASARAETLVDTLLAQYDKVTSVTCEVRKQIEGEENKVRMLSRVHWQRPDKIHVENFSPLERRYVADGERLFYYVKGDPKGFSRRIENLDSDWLISLRKVPGSPMDILLLVENTEEIDLPSTANYPVRKGYETENAFAVLCLDDTGRLVHVDVYRSPAMEYKTAEYDYKQYEEAIEGVWIPMLHEVSVDNLDGMERGERTRFDHLEVNISVPERLFVAEPFFKGVEFVDNFEAIYE
jgi:hypothetical protein